MVDYASKRKIEWLGYTGEIKGGNVNTYECIVCGKELTQREYLEIVDMCRPCKRKAYSRGQHIAEDSIETSYVEVIMI